MRNFPRNSSVSVAIYRLPTTGDRKYPSTPTYTVEGNILPYFKRGTVHSLEGGMYVIEYELYVTSNVDIQRSDKLIINGTTYYVKSLISLTPGILPFTVAYISTEA